MGLYEGIKDAIGIAQKADNIELYRQLLDLGAQALEMQSEIARLTAENEELRKAKDINSRIIRHEQPFITLERENEKIRYCATCWGKLGMLIQLRCSDNTGGFECPECHTEGIFNQDAHNASLERDAQIWNSIYST